MARVLITGISGGLARLTAHRLLEDQHEIVGVDYRPLRGFLQPAIKFYQANYNKTRIEDIVRRFKPTHVLHLGRVGNLKEHANKRFDLNVIGSAKIVELCLKHKVQRLVLLSTFHIYGADPQNHIPIYEDEPMRAGQSNVQLADAVQLDNQACTWVYRHRKLRTVVLRPTNIVGPNIRNAISQYLRQPTLVYMAGFNPVWQFIHQQDIIEAIRLAFYSNCVGIYNVNGAGEIPIVEAMKLTGARLIPLPNFMVDLALRFGRQFSDAIPAYLLEFLKYPCVISDKKFRNEVGYKASVGLEKSVRSVLH